METQTETKPVTQLMELMDTELQKIRDELFEEFKKHGRYDLYHKLTDLSLMEWRKGYITGLEIVNRDKNESLIQSMMADTVKIKEKNTPKDDTVHRE